MSHRPRFRSCLPLVAVLALVAASVANAQIEEPRIPLRTALAEINTVRVEYAENFNAKNVEAVTRAYLPDAIVIRDDGSLLIGQDAIGEAFAEEAPNWPHAVISSDSVRVYGHSAWDVGTFTTHDGNGGEMVSRYLVILRRDMNGWRIARVASVPVTEGMQSGN